MTCSVLDFDCAMGLSVLYEREGVPAEVQLRAPGLVPPRKVFPVTEVELRIEAPVQDPGEGNGVRVSGEEVWKMLLLDTPEFCPSWDRLWRELGVGSG